MTVDAANRPDQCSSAYERTRPDRMLIADVLEGLPAMQRLSASMGRESVGKSCSRYLTRWPDESDGAYERRLAEAMWTPLFADLLFGLTSKPFSREVSLKEGTSARIDEIVENVDGEGNNLHVFSHQVFEAGVRDGLCAILVDSPPAPEGATVEQERAAGIRPYWVKIEAQDLLALYTEMQGGVEVITHARINECVVVRDGFGERKVERVRVLEPGRYELWEMQKKGNESSWERIDEGPMSIGVVPITVFYAGRRRGPQDVTPPLVNLARMQVELFRKENNLKSVQNRTAFPVYAANKMSPGDEAISVGPGAVLYGGSQGEWSVIEPNGKSMEHLQEDIEAHKQEMRRLGLQPLMPGSGNVTATATSVEAAKAHSLVQRWALGLKDTLENAFALTARWIKEEAEAEVFVHTDFGVDIQNPEDIRALLELRKLNEISREVVLGEMKRRGVLSADFDVEQNAADLDAETAVIEDMVDPIGATMQTQMPEGVA